MKEIVTRALLFGSVPVGVGVGFWTSSLWPPFPNCRPYGCSYSSYEPTFQAWQCALIGAAAAAFLVVVSITARRARFYARQ
jgi:hypothetical protein